MVFGVAVLLGLKAEAEAMKSDKAMVSFMVMGCYGRNVEERGDGLKL